MFSVRIQTTALKCKLTMIQENEVSNQVQLFKSRAIVPSFLSLNFLLPQLAVTSKLHI